jgi:hypothetical protein
VGIVSTSDLYRWVAGAMPENFDEADRRPGAGHA